MKNCMFARPSSPRLRRGQQQQYQCQLPARLVALLCAAAGAEAASCDPKYGVLGTAASDSPAAQSECFAIKNEAECNSHQLPKSWCLKDSDCRCEWDNNKTIQSETNMPIWFVSPFYHFRLAHKLLAGSSRSLFSPAD